MKLDVAYKVIGEIPNNLIIELEELIDDSHWPINNMRNQMVALKKTDAIIFRHFGDYSTPFMTNYREAFIDYPVFNHYRNTVDKFLEELRIHYNFTDYICFLARLYPHESVDMHIDYGPYLEECHRIHVPIKTNPNVFYIINEDRSYWERGKIYEFDNTRLHGVANESDEHRIHMLFNLYP